MNKSILFAIALMGFGMAAQTQAQTNPLIAQYYSNRYLGNPAMAGLNRQVDLNLAYRSQWADVPGAPVMQGFSADYGFKKAGIGVQATFDQAGLERVSRIMGTYAYHLPLNDRNTALHFGLSLGFLTQRLALDEMEGAAEDPRLASYNGQGTHIDGDFGIAFTSAGLNVEAALPNLKRLLNQDNVQSGNLPTFYMTLGYIISLGETAVQPKLAYRGIKNRENIVDAGVQISFVNRQVMLTAIYHSTQTASFGIAMDYKGKYLIGLSHTLQTGSLNRFNNGIFEVGLRGRF